MQVSKQLTISNRWRDWAKIEPWWSYPCLCSFIGSILCLGVHLWLLQGWWRGFFLIGMITLALCTETILWLRAKVLPTLWWWFWFHTYIVLGVLGFEMASYFFG